MLEKGVVERLTISWASPVALVRKKAGTLWFCVDYWRMNNVTRKDTSHCHKLTQPWIHWQTLNGSAYSICWVAIGRRKLKNLTVRNSILHNRGLVSVLNDAFWTVQCASNPLNLKVNEFCSGWTSVVTMLHRFRWFHYCRHVVPETVLKFTGGAPVPSGGRPQTQTIKVCLLPVFSKVPWTCYLSRRSNYWPRQG